jgi:hypothetical protein
MKGLAEKWWPEEVRAASLREQGNELFQRNEVDAALAKYGEALQIGECTYHLSLLCCVGLPDPTRAGNLKVR